MDSLVRRKKGPRQSHRPSIRVKVGALRFLLNILVGVCNKPEPNSWFTREEIRYPQCHYYQDGTGISLELQRGTASRLYDTAYVFTVCLARERSAA
jgi:hypothetical protein